MSFIFFGFLLGVLGGFNMNQVNIGPLISIGAYYLIYKGILTVDRENPFFKKTITLLYILMGLSGLSFLIGISNSVGFSGFVGIAVFVIDIIVVYNVIKGIQVYADQLKDPTQPTKLFKRWRIQYILLGIIIATSIVMVILAVTTVSWAALIEMINALRNTLPSNQEAIQAIISSYLNILQPILVILFLWIFAMAALAITMLVFKIMFLVSMYRIQADYALALKTPTPTEKPIDLP